MFSRAKIEPNANDPHARTSAINYVRSNTLSVCAEIPASRSHALDSYITLARVMVRGSPIQHHGRTLLLYKSLKTLYNSCVRDITSTSMCFSSCVICISRKKLPRDLTNNDPTEQHFSSSPQKTRFKRLPTQLPFHQHPSTSPPRQCQVGSRGDCF